MRRRDLSSPAQLKECHFGALNDQLLNDIGLQRSEMRAVEYGILPRNQALHDDRSGGEGGHQAQSRT